MKMNRTVIYQASRLLLLIALMTGLGGLCFHHWRPAMVAAQAQQVTLINAANFNPDKRVAPDSIGAAFGQFITQNNQTTFIANSLPLPTTLGGVRVAINGVNAGLFFVASTQINLLIPATLQDAPSATVTVTNSDNSTRTGTVTIQRAAPGIFTMRGTGQGVIAAYTTFDGVTNTNVFNPDLTERVVEAGTTQRPNIMVMFATGIRNVPAQNPTDGNGVAESVTVKVQGVPQNVLFAGPAPGFAGLDQINYRLSPELAGLGSVGVEVIAGTASSKITTPATALPTFNMGPVSLIPPLNVTPITFGQTLTGELTVNDQIQKSDSSGNTYFIDGYRFTTTQANTVVGLDMRSTGNSLLDPAVLLYRINNNQLVEIGSDDQSGGLGNGRVENNNALMLAVLPTPGDYAILASSANVQPDGTGAYSLRLFQPSIQPIAYGANISASIANTDNQTSTGLYFDAYWFQGTANDNVDIRLTSTAFDSLLLLYQHETGLGFPITTNDNETAATTNSRITQRLPATGIYIIWGTPFELNRFGAYNLTLNRLSSLTDVVETQAVAPVSRLRDLRDERREGLAGRSAERTVQE